MRSASSTSGDWYGPAMNTQRFATRDWIVAYWHHPPYSKGTHDSDLEIELIEMRTHVLPVLEDHGVAVVFGGHSHSYERSYLIDGHYGSSSEFGVL